MMIMIIVMMIMIIIIDTASDNIKDEFLFKPIEKQYKSEKKRKNSRDDEQKFTKQE